MEHYGDVDAYLDANIALVQELADNLALMFFKGILLDDPAGALEAVGPNSHPARRMMFTSVEDIDRHADALRAGRDWSRHPDGNPRAGSRYRKLNSS